MIVYPNKSHPDLNIYPTLKRSNPYTVKKINLIFDLQGPNQTQDKICQITSIDIISQQQKCEFKVSIPDYLNTDQHTLCPFDVKFENGKTERYHSIEMATAHVKRLKLSVVILASYTTGISVLQTELNIPVKLHLVRKITRNANYYIMLKSMLNAHDRFEFKAELEESKLDLRSMLDDKTTMKMVLKRIFSESIREHFTLFCGTAVLKSLPINWKIYTGGPDEILCVIDQAVDSSIYYVLSSIPTPILNSYKTQIISLLAKYRELQHEGQSANFEIKVRQLCYAVISLQGLRNIMYTFFSILILEINEQIQELIDHTVEAFITEALCPNLL